MKKGGRRTQVVFDPSRRAQPKHLISQNGAVVNHGFKSDDDEWDATMDDTTSTNNNSKKRTGREIVVTIDTGPPGDLGEIGFSLIGGSKDPYFVDNNGIFVIEVTPESPVKRALDAGDQILQVDGVSVENVPLHVAYNLIRAGNRRVVITAFKHPDNEMTIIPDDSDDSGPDEDGDDNEGSYAASSIDNPTRGGVGFILEDDTENGAENEVEFMTGRRGHLDDLDFEFAGGRDQPYIPRNGGIFITKVKRGSLLEGHISSGDRIIKVDGVEMMNVPQHVLKNLIRASDGKLTMIVRKPNREQIQKAVMHDATDGLDIRVRQIPGRDEIIVDIDSGKKGTRGRLGFKIAGGRNKPCVPGDPGIFIKQVKPASAVEKVLKPGDKILAIGGQSVINVNQAQAIDLIKAADRKVRLHIKQANHEKESELRKNRRMSEVFPDEKMEEFRKAFETYSKKDRIPTKSLPLVCKSLGYNFTLQDLDFLISGEFHDGSGITFAEFMKMMSEISFAQNSDFDILEAFHVFDHDKRGYFDVGDLKAAFECIAEEAAIPPEEMSELLSIADSNQDGRVYFNDFKNLVMPIFHQY